MRKDFAPTAINAELKARVDRIVSGDVRIEDIARLYAGKRFETFGCASFREIGDFAAHPNERDRGPVNGRIQDMLTTFLPMFDRARGKEPDLKAILDRVSSNLRMISDEQIARLCFGLSRERVEKVANSALMKMRANLFSTMTAEEETIIIAIGDRVIWNPAFRGDEIFRDFKSVIVKNKLLLQQDAYKIDSAKELVIMYAICAMHGSAYNLKGLRGELKAGFSNKQENIEITATISVVGFPKPVSMKVGLLWTELPAAQHCSQELLGDSGPWNFPIEIRERKLSRIGAA